METETKAVALLPDRAANKVKPKPKRSEIIDALVKLKHKEYEEFHVKRCEAMKKLRAEIEEMFLKHIETVDLKMEVEYYAISDAPSLTGKYVVHFNSLPPAIRKRLNEAKQLNNSRFEPDYGYTGKYTTYGVWNEKIARDSIAKQLKLHENNGVDRVHAMLTEPVIRKSLEKLLGKIEQPPEPKAIEAVTA